MKKYDTPNVDMVSCNEQDVVCESRGITVGDGGADITNWRWQLPGSATYGVSRATTDRSGDL